MSLPSVPHDPDPSTEPDPLAWPAEWADTLSDAALRSASSAAIFNRGRAYARSGDVEVLDEDPMPEPALYAEVAGSETYMTEVWIENDAIAGRCDCPHAAEGWFCKHQVAVALVWRERRAGPAAPAEESTMPTARGGTSRPLTAAPHRLSLHDWLHAQDAATLADLLLELADADPELAQRLQRRREIGEKAFDPDSLFPLIEELLEPERGDIDWRESAGQARDAQAVLQLLQQAHENDPQSAVDLGLHAMRRAWELLETADDSDGELSGLCADIGAEWIAALRAAGPQPGEFGNTYLQLQLDDPIGCFDAEAAERAIGRPALARYRSALAERWRQAKTAARAGKAERAARAAHGKGPAPSHEAVTGLASDLWKLEPLHLAQLEASGQVDEALAVLREDLTDGHAHAKLVACLERHGRYDEALAQAEQGSRAFADDWPLRDVLIRCCERAGRTADVLALRRRQFEHSPGVGRYRQVLEAGVADRQDGAALRLSLLDFLAQQEVLAMKRPAPAWAPPGAAAANPTVRDVSLRAEILCDESRWLEACELVQPPMACRNTVLLQIARHLPAERVEQSLTLMLRVFTDAMTRAKSPYRDELILVGEIARRMDAARRAAWLAQLRGEFKRKVNFIGGLPRG